MHFHVFFVQRLLEGTDFGYVPHTSVYHVIYQWIALELGYKLMLKSHVQFMASKAMAKSVNFSDCEKWTFLTFACQSL